MKPFNYYSSKTPGGRLVYLYTKKQGKVPRCGDCKKRLQGVELYPCQNTAPDDILPPNTPQSGPLTEEERLLAEAMFETAEEDLSGPALEFVEQTSEEKEENDVPKSKVQFPFRRRNSSRNRKLFCVVIFLVLIIGALVATFFILKAKTFSFDLKLSKGQILHYRLTQESNYEGMKQVHSRFTEEVFVQIVNKTGSLCWMKVFLKSLPSFKTRHFSFLVSVNLGGETSMNNDGENRLRVYTQGHSNTVNYYVLNFLTQLLPVIKIDLFEVILSQITTRKHEIVVQHSKFFPGDVTMTQNIRMSKEHVLVTSRVEPEAFSSFGTSNSNNLLPHMSLSFEEDASISKATGMISTSDMELSAKIPLSGELGCNGTALSMHFKSSLRFVREEYSIPDQDNFENGLGYIEMPRLLLTPSKIGLKYFSPNYKHYDEKNSNVVAKVKELLNMTLFHNSTKGSKHIKSTKNLEEFAKSFHKVVQPGVETNFAEAETDDEKRDRFRGFKTTSGDDKNAAERHKDFDDDDDDDYNGDTDALPDDDDYRNQENDYSEHGRRWNEMGQPVPQYPDEDTEEDNDDYNYNGPSPDAGEDFEHQSENGPDKGASRASHEQIDEPGQHVKNQANPRPDGPSPDTGEDFEHERENGPDKGASRASHEQIDEPGHHVKNQANPRPDGPSPDAGEDFEHERENGPDKGAPIASHEHIDEPGHHVKNQANLRPDGSNDERFNLRKTSESHELRGKHKHTQHTSKTDRLTIHANKSKKRKLKKGKKNSKKSNPTSKPKLDSGKRNSKSNETKEEKMPKTGETMATPQHQQQSFFDRIFDRVWNDDDDDDKKNEEPESKFSNLIPFSFSSDFPFVHFQWPHFNSRKRRSLEANGEQKVRRDADHRDKRRLFEDEHIPAPHFTGRDLEPIWDIISPATIKKHPKKTSQVFQHRIMGLEITGELEHEVNVVTSSSRDDNSEWVIRLSLLLSVDKHKFKVLGKSISMKEIEERFMRNSKPKYEYGTVHAGTLE
ncbi:hypothetical protein QZH41_001482 [Actinostola sp. cb2023]|nr:hypothetical protein QZH41_001482 [Actinostola sp. cb2023]